MKKLMCLMISVIMIICLFSGCGRGKTPGGASSGITPTPDNATETSTATDSAGTNATETTEQTEATEPSQTEATEPSQTGTTEPSQTEATEPSQTEATEPSQAEKEPVDEEEIIAGGNWDHGPVKWKITKDGVLRFTGNTYIQGKPTYIWKDYANVITKVVFEEGITTIPENAFSDMPNITSVHFADTVTQIGGEAFANCTGLESVTIAKGIQTIGASAFYNCTNLKTVSFAANCTVTEIQDYAFSQSGLQAFYAPASLRTIYSYAFQNCAALETVCLDGGVSTLKARVFENCTGLKNLVLGESLTDVGGLIFRGSDAVTTLEYNTTAGFDFQNFTQLTTLKIGGNRTQTGSFRGCTSLTSVTFGPGVTEISDHAFRKTNLQSITIPATITTIGSFAFRDTPLEKVFFTGNAPTFTSSSDFTFYNVTATMYYPAGDSTWNASVCQNYGGTLTWVAN